MKTDEYQAGDRIYYTGDMANIEDEGIIIKRHEADNYAPVNYDIHLNDGREFRRVYHLSFAAGSGRRFWLLSEYKADRAQKMREFQEHLRRMQTVI